MKDETPLQTLEGNMHVPDKQKHTHTVEAEKGKKKESGKEGGEKKKEAAY